MKYIFRKKKANLSLMLWMTLNPITPGVLDQRLLPGGGVFRTPKLFYANLDHFLDLWNDFWAIDS